MKTTPSLHPNLAVALLAAATCWPTAAVTLDKSFSGESFLDSALGGTTSAARPELAGVVLEDEIQPFSFSNVSGTVQNRVVRETSSGTLDFYWRVQVSPAGPGVTAGPNGGAISTFRLGDFGYENINDADWRLDGLGGAAPYLGRIFNSTDRPDGAINFLFTDGLVESGDAADGLAGSRFFFLHTDAADYTKSATYDLLDAQQNLSAVFATFAPGRNLPDSGSSAVLMLAAIGSLTIASRSKGKPQAKGNW